jgi:hypothetical protein
MLYCYASRALGDLSGGADSAKTSVDHSQTGTALMLAICAGKQPGGENSSRMTSARMESCFL